jgi:sugar phosphate isomerase/epimerase
MHTGMSRRNFLEAMAAGVGGLTLARSASHVLGSTMPAAMTPSAMDWADHIGLELFTVRDLIARDYLGTLEQVAQIGYKEVEPAEGYANLSPQQFRAELDRLGLKVPSTHSGITAGSTADAEQQLAGFQIMGIEYTSLSEPRPAGGGGRGSPGPAPTSPAAQRRMMEQFIRSQARPRTVDDVKQEAARYNTYGKLAQRFGIKLLRHNHTVEFIPCQGSAEVPYTILLAETDPDLVVFQMDIGWASVAGQNPIELFQKHPGRFVLWHVKDVACLTCLPPASQEGARMAGARLVPVGTGDVDYGEIFTYADVAGMKHFAVEQDSAADWGDSLAAARVSYEHLHHTLTGAA